MIKNKAFHILAAMMVFAATPAMAASDDFGAYFTASGPAALGSGMDVQTHATLGDADFLQDSVADSLNAIVPAAGGDVSFDGAAAPVGTFDGTSAKSPVTVPGTDFLAGPSNPPIPGMDANPSR